MRLPIQTLSAEQYGQAFYKLFQIASIVQRSGEQHIELDFSHTRFVPAPLLAGLACLITQWNEAGRVVTCIPCDHLTGYFNFVHFPDMLDTAADVHAIAKLAAFGSRTYTPLLLFPCPVRGRASTGNMETAVNTVCDTVAAQINATRDYGEALDYLISELANNVMHHSGKDKGLLFVQTYRQLGLLDIVVADNGGGVYASYKGNPNFHPQSEAEAIQLAVTGSSSKDLAETRGFGITTSHDVTIKGLGGSMVLWSGATLFATGGAGEGRIIPATEGARFNGCLVSLRLRIQSHLNIPLMQLIS
jgi:hypothetical protein